VEVSQHEHYEYDLPTNAVGEFARSALAHPALALSGVEC